MAIFECRALRKRFGDTLALDHVDLTLEAGRIIGLLGPNGSGKTTLLKLANGLISPDGGILLIDGKQPGRETKAEVSYLPDRVSLPDWMTLKGVLDYYGDFYADFDRARAEEMASALRLPTDRRVRQLSKGTQEKLQLICTMSRRAKLYLLDEPIGGVDPATREYVLNTIIASYDPAAAVVISTHLISEVESVLDEAVFIRDGSVLLHESVDAIREAHGCSVDAYFREVFRC